MTMRTPGDDIERAAGFLGSEAVVRTRRHRRDQGLRRDFLGHNDGELGNIADVTLAAGVPIARDLALACYETLGAQSAHW